MYSVAGIFALLLTTCVHPLKSHVYVHPLKCYVLLHIHVHVKVSQIA